MNENIKEKTIKGFFWTGTGKMFEQVVRWIISIILARLLSPSDYGLMALTSVFIYFINYFNELSIGAAIIQKKEIDESYLSSGFWIILCFSILTYGFTLVAAGPVAHFFEQEKLTAILQVAGVSFVIMAFGVVPANLISRELKFYIVAKINFIATICSGLTSLTMAYTGFGVWSLVFGLITKNLFYSLSAFYYSSWRPKFLFSASGARSLLKFGLPLTGSKSLNTLYYNSDTLIVGKLLGEKMLGYYYMAFHLSTMLVDRFSDVIYKVNLPVLSLFQESRTRTCHHVIKTSRYLTILVFPLLIGLFFVADDFVTLILSEKWTPIIYPLKLFCFIGIAKAMNSVMTPVLIARGRTDKHLRYNMTSALILPTSFFIGSLFGINGVVYAWLIIYPLLTAYLMYMVFKEIHLSLVEYVKNLMPGVTACAFMAVMILLFQTLHFDGRAIRLTGSILVGSLSYMGFILVVHREVLRETKSLFQSMKAKKAET